MPALCILRLCRRGGNIAGHTVQGSNIETNSHDACEKGVQCYNPAQTARTRLPIPAYHPSVASLLRHFRSGVRRTAAQRLTDIAKPLCFPSPRYPMQEADLQQIGHGHHLLCQCPQVSERAVTCVQACISPKTEMMWGWHSLKNWCVP